MRKESRNIWKNYKNLFEVFSSKSIWICYLCFLILVGCTSPSTTSSSAERKAKELTSVMQKTLNLSEEQVGKVLLVNVVNIGLMDKLKEDSSQKEVQTKYSAEMRKILSDNQYKIFLENFIK